MVTHWSKSARIVLVEGKVDLEATDALLAAALDPQRGGKGGKSAERRPGPKAPAADQVAVTETAMSRATARDREASADLKTLRLEREAERLVSREEFERVTEEVFAGVRDAMLAVPPNVADLLAAETNPRRCMQIVRDAIVAALNSRADLEDALAERTGKTRQ